MKAICFTFVTCRLYYTAYDTYVLVLVLVPTTTPRFRFAPFDRIRIMPSSDASIADSMSMNEKEERL